MSLPGSCSKVVVITGASRGLGRQIALTYGRAGHRILVNYTSRAKEATEVCEEILNAGGEALSCRADVRIASEVDAMVESVLRQWGTVDILVNNAGLTKDNLLLRMPEQDWDAVLDTNLKGPFYCIRAVSRVMMKQRSGHIINIASIVGVRGREGQANYSAAKAGLIGLSKAASQELGKHNIQVNAVLPGYLQTSMGSSVSESVRTRILKETTLGRCSDLNETAQFICHLSLMNNVSGQVFNLDSRII